MNKEIHQLNIQHLSYQKNVFLVMSFFLTIAVVTLTIMFFMKNEKIVIVPHAISEKIWVHGSKVSESYLKQQAQVVSMLFLSKTPSSAKEQNDLLLEITSPALYGKLKRKLNDEKKILEEQGASYVFLPSEIKVDESSMTVEVKGDRSTYVSGKLLTKLKERYKYKFMFNGQRLLLDGIFREEI